MDGTLTSRVLLEVDLGRLRRNYERIAASVAPLGVIAVLKADAYGMGMRPVAREFVKAGVSAIAVAELPEALQALDLGVPVLLLGHVFPEDIEPAIARGIRLPVASLESARLISETALRLDCRARVHVAVDTGMGRLGIMFEEAVAVIRRIAALPGLELEGFYSHFAMAFPHGRDFTLAQLRNAHAVLAELEKEGIVFEWRHLAGSDAVNFYPEACRAPCTHIRLGTGFYGAAAQEHRRMLQLEQVLTLRARLAQIRIMPAGRSVGYSATYTCPRPMRVGTVAAGYADGLTFGHANRGHVIIRGHVCPVLGRVSMDYCNVSLESVPDAEEGDPVYCLGGPYQKAVTVKEFANWKGSQPCEILCSFGPRAVRRYVER